MSVMGKIQALNAAIREAIPGMKAVARENVHAQILVRAVKFANAAEWHIDIPVKIQDLAWTDLTAAGMTALGSALELVAEQLSLAAMPERGLPPVLVLVTDGEPTDDYKAGLRRLLDQPWGRKAVRIAIAIGEDASLPVLEEFIANPEIKPLRATNTDQLHALVRWASTVVLRAASSAVSTSRASRDPNSGEASTDTGIAASLALPDSDTEDVW